MFIGRRYDPDKVIEGVQRAVKRYRTMPTVRKPLSWAGGTEYCTKASFGPFYPQFRWVDLPEKPSLFLKLSAYLAAKLWILSFVSKKGDSIRTRKLREILAL